MRNLTPSTRSLPSKFHFKGENLATKRKAQLLNKLDRSTSKLLSKTYMSSLTSKSGLDHSGPRSGNFLSVESLAFDESESLINLHLASNLNENTFHLSPNEVNFYNERLRSNSRVCPSCQAEES